MDPVLVLTQMQTAHRKRVLPESSSTLDHLLWLGWSLAGHTCSPACPRQLPTESRARRSGRGQSPVSIYMVRNAWNSIRDVAYLVIFTRRRTNHVEVLVLERDRQCVFGARSGCGRAVCIGVLLFVRTKMHDGHRAPCEALTDLLQRY